MKKNKSFTLIELLVVIAIIGLLSSIVLVNMKGTRDKARIAKGLEFSQSVNHALGAYAVGIWRFDEGIDTIAYDSSGYGNNGTINGASYTTGILGTALSFNGVNDYVNAGNDASLDAVEEITISLWVKWVGNAGGAAYAQVVTRPPNLRLWVYDTRQILWTVDGATGGSHYLISTNDTAGKVTNSGWTHVVATFDTSDTLKIYLNGVLNNSTAGPTQITGISGVNLRIGAYYGSFNGLIDDVRIYTQALSTSEIQKHYAEGLERHKNLVIQ